MDGGRIRVVSWNIERGYRPKGLCRFLSALDADVYLLTELDRGNKRTRRVDLFRELEAALGIAGRFALEFEEKDSFWRQIIRQGGPGGGTHGNAVFSRFPMADYREVRLPVGARLKWDGSTLVPELFEPRSGSRVAQLFEANVQGRRVCFVNTHLENWRCGWDLRRRQLEAALAGARGDETVLAGDMNCLEGILCTLGRRRPVNREVSLLRGFLRSKGLRDPWPDTDYTCFNLGTRSKLDWLGISSGVEVLERALHRTGLSDHSCLVAELSLR